jgi:hypothetical protein
MSVSNELLGESPSSEGVDSGAANHTLRTAPILTGEAYQALGPKWIPQCALYGRVISQNSPGFPEKIDIPQLLVNTNAPFSAVVCGVQANNFSALVSLVELTPLSTLQGSGKSHSTSVLLESCLIKDPRLGSLPAPLSGLLCVYIYRRLTWCH